MFQSSISSVELVRSRMSQRAPPVVGLVKLHSYKGTQSVNTEQPSVPQDPHGLSPDPLSGSPHEVPTSVGSELSESQNMPNFHVEIKEETAEEGLECEIEVKEEFLGSEQTEDSFFAERGTDLFGSAGSSTPSPAEQSVDPQASTSYPRSETDSKPNLLTPVSQSDPSPCKLNPPLQNEASHSEADPLAIPGPLSHTDRRALKSYTLSHNSLPILRPQNPSPVFRSPVSHRTREVSRTRPSSELCSDVAPNFPQSAISSPTPDLEPPGLSGPVISIPNYLIVLPANMPASALRISRTATKLTISRTEPSSPGSSQGISENGSDNLTRNVPKVKSVGSKRKREADRKYQCVFCHVAFEKESEFSIHTSALHCHEPGASEKDPTPEKSAASNAEETAASETAHIQFVCQVCFRAFLSVPALDVHRQVYHGTQRDRSGTQQRSKRARTEQTARGPETTGTADKHFKCNFCSRVFELELELKMHLNVYHTVHKISNEDPNEEESSNSRPNDEMQKSAKKDEKKVAPKRKRVPIPDTRVRKSNWYHCNHCVGTFDTLQKFNKHMEALHAGHATGAQARSSDQASASETELDPRVCKLCSRTFLDKNMLEIHTQTVHTSQVGSGPSTEAGDHPFVCRVCKATFVNIRALNEHIRASHARQNDPNQPKVLRKIRPKLTQAQSMPDTESKHQFVCEFCTRDFKTIEILNIHKTAVHGTKKVIKRLDDSRKKKRMSCFVCNAEFVNSMGLKNHLVMVHSPRAGGGTVACTLCQAHFPAPLPLWEHMTDVHDL